MVPAVVAQAEDVSYAGLDISPLMVGEATRSNAALVAAGRAGFHLGSAEDMPFPDASFDQVFSAGVVHFWADPVGLLSEVRRVLRGGGLSLMGCLHPRTAPPGFARPEHGFHLREAAEWEALHRAAGFTKVEAETMETQQIGPDGTPAQRCALKLTAQA